MHQVTAFCLCASDFLSNWPRFELSLLFKPERSSANKVGLALKADAKRTLSPEVLLSGTAETVLDAIKAEPVPQEMMDLALQLQAKFDAQNKAASDPAQGQGSGES